MCWGRGPCPSFKCSSTLITTDGYRVTYQTDRRYQLKGRLNLGDVSLTIQNVSMDDSGQYCCRIEVPGWFNDIKNTMSLQVMPANTTKIPATPHFSTAPPTPAWIQSHKTAKTTRIPTPRISTAPPTPAHTESHRTAVTTRAPATLHVSVAPPTPIPTPTQSHKAARTTSVSIPPSVSTPAPPTPAHTLSNKTETTPPFPTQTVVKQITTPQEAKTQPFTSTLDSWPTDGNGTVTQSAGGPWHNQSVFPAPNQQVTPKEVYIGILVFSSILFIILVVIIIQKYYISKKMTWTLSKVLWTRPQIQAFQLQDPVEDQVYIVKDNVYNLD